MQSRVRKELRREQRPGLDVEEFQEKKTKLWYRVSAPIRDLKGMCKLNAESKTLKD
jgi:hypothetical protein